VLLQRVVFLIIHLAVQFLSCLLRLYDTQEGLSLGLSLVCQHDFLLQELLFAHVFKFLGLTGSLFGFSSFLGTEVSLTLFEGSLGAQGIDFSLAIGSLLLHLSEPLDLVLLFFTDTALFFNTSLLLKVLFFVVTDYLHFLILLFLNTGLLGVLSQLVGHFNFSHHLMVLLFLNLSVLQVLLLKLLDCPQHLRLLFLQLLALFLPLNFSVFNLVNDDCSSQALGLDAFLFALLKDLQFF